MIRCWYSTLFTLPLLIKLVSQKAILSFVSIGFLFSSLLICFCRSAFWELRSRSRSPMSSVSMPCSTSRRRLRMAVCTLFNSLCKESNRLLSLNSLSANSATLQAISSMTSGCKILSTVACTTTRSSQSFFSLAFTQVCFFLRS